ncbi:hypothetical protein GCM10007423_63710 [Dyadobacter endophyticus]|uniref:Uncharacterized protein n=1 Tax=Dyadobacter endophyticus TaxID=1749036 RepID=A0ABQ1ZD09_9BACT|nr:hypothetical protein [Dyadobacter endophyticus]GGH55784.1 hypothetical protein GCM10007423_63710 [Dyadobacter endophyticus]
MTIYLVHIRKYAIKKNDSNRRFYPVNSPDANTEILVEVSEKFPEAYQYWTLRADDFTNKSKILVFKNIRAMFKYFEENNVDVGTSVASFYKVKGEVPSETAPDGVLIYSYKNINIHALRIN